MLNVDSMRTALTVAGSDSIGGAGIQADIKAMSAVGVHATSVITAVTAQNTCGVDAIFPMSTDAVQAQLEAVLKDCNIKAIKTGMLYNAEIVELVADILEDHEVPLIVDPVMVSGTGYDLCTKDFIKAMNNKLIPICELVTPNKHEAEKLSGIRINNYDDVTYACEVIGKEGSSVLLKGGHFDTKDVVDYFYLSAAIDELRYPKLAKAGHGSGCTLSSYIAAHMAKGMDLTQAVIKSRAMIQESIASQYVIGKGDVVVNTIPQMKEDNSRFQVLDSIDRVANELIDLLPVEMVPKCGMNIAVAAKNCKGPEDIAAIDRRMYVHNGMIKKGGPAKYGSAEQLSYVLLDIIKRDPKTRCIMTLAYTSELADVIEEIGMKSIVVNFGKGHVASAMDATMGKSKKIPDAIIDKNPKDRVIRILAKDVDDMMDKIHQMI